MFLASVPPEPLQRLTSFVHTAPPQSFNHLCACPSSFKVFGKTYFDLTVINEARHPFSTSFGMRAFNFQRDIKSDWFWLSCTSVKFGPLPVYKRVFRADRAPPTAKPRAVDFFFVKQIKTLHRQRMFRQETDTPKTNTFSF